MSEPNSFGTPPRVKIAVGLGVIAIALAAVFLGYKAAVATAVFAFLAVGGDVAFFGLLGRDDNEGESER